MTNMQFNRYQKFFSLPRTTSIVKGRSFSCNSSNIVYLIAFKECYEVHYIQGMLGTILFLFTLMFPQKLGKFYNFIYLQMTEIFSIMIQILTLLYIYY